MKIPNIQDIINNPQKINRRIYKVQYCEFVDFLENKYPGLKFSEQLYRYFFNISEPPRCKVCGREVKYRNFTIGYSTYCSSACARRDPETQDKINNTCQERYGYKHYNNREKNKITCQERYGCDNPFQSDIVKDKIKTTINERYGVDYPSQSAEIQKTREVNTLNKYGVKHHMMLDSVKDKVNKSIERYRINNDPNLLSYDDNGNRRMICPHPTCNLCKEKFYIIDSQNYYARKEYGLEPCTRILPIKCGHSSNTTLEIFVHNLLDEYNIKYETNVRNIIPPKELDIYIPDKNVAIECNGLYWHSGKDKLYHYNKFIECQAKGIQLITIWEDQIYNSPEVIKSIILSKVNIYNTKIGARECIIKNISPNECSKFLNENHLQGATKPQVRLGMYYMGEMVGVMTFAKRSPVSGPKNINDWELTRFCNKRNTTIIGGASKLLRHFIKIYKPKVIYSFASNDISNGSLYDKLGFIKEDYTSAYWYIDKRTLKRYHRSRFNKSNLEKMGYINDTEENIMLRLPYYKIYDCGHIRYKLIVEN